MWQPFGVHTSVPPAEWHPEPKFRGTYNVLSTCLFTMSLCIWTSVHLNLPEHKKQHLQVYRKTGWLIMGLLAPEVVAWNAWEQRREVKRLTQAMEKIHARRFHYPENRPDSWKQFMACLGQNCNPTPWCQRTWHKMRVALYMKAGDLDEAQKEAYLKPDEKETFKCPWTDTHSWLTIMGGFVFDTSSANEQFLPEDRERVVCSAEGMLLLAEKWPHLVPRISAETIMDRSKSDGLAKFLTCWQAIWFCVQCVFRLTTGFTISLLELNTFGHAIAALCIYLIWWTKPKDIQEPTFIGGENPTDEVHSVAAIFTLLSPIGYASKRHLMGYVSETVDEVNKDLVWAPAEPDEYTRDLPPLSVAIYVVDELMAPSSIMIRGKCWQLQKLRGSRRDRQNGEERRQTDLTDAFPGALGALFNRLVSPPQICIDDRTAARLSRVQTQHSITSILEDGRFGDRRGGERLDARERLEEERVGYEMAEYEVPRDERDERDERVRDEHYELETLVRARNRNWCLDSKRFGKVPTLAMLTDLAAVTIATSAYGLLHALAWNAAYPSRVELLLWRASSLTVALTGPGLVAIIAGLSLAIAVAVVVALALEEISLLARFWKWVSSILKPYSTLGTWIYVIFLFLLGLTFLPLGLAMYALPVWYAFSRAFLVVECFINIAHLSKDMLVIPAFANYIPHVT